MGKIHYERIFAGDLWPVYLYKINSDNDLTCYEGAIHNFQDEKHVPAWTSFRTCEDGSYRCSPKEGIIYRDGLWFKERNDKKAAILLSMHYEQKMEKLQNKMDKYIDILESLDSITQEEN